MSNSRRTFLTSASLLAAGNALGLKPFGQLNALAQTAGQYKALVCVFLFGGNDANNMVIPFDVAGYNSYSTIRGPIAIPQSSLLQLGPTPNFALHPNMPEMQALYNSGKLAILSNVGTLLQPTTKAQYQASQVTSPKNLFSHPTSNSNGRTKCKAPPGQPAGQAASPTASTRSTTQTPSSP